MKKSLLVLGVLIAVLIGSFALAGSGYEYGEGMYAHMRLDVCKLDYASCTAGDWYNYSIDDGGGGGKTLVVSPGDTFTLKGTVSVTGEGGDPLYPTFKVSLTNGGFIDSIDYFGTGKGDIDGDGISYNYNSVPDDITLTDPIDSTNQPQIGSVAVKIKDDVPDQTVITVRFYLDSTSDHIIKGPSSIAYADDLYGSTIRVLVSNPSPNQYVEATATANATETPSLPRTGAHN